MRAFVTEALGKQAIEATDRAGFVVNSLLVPYLLSAIRMFEAGYAPPKTSTEGWSGGCGHPMGPLALSDLIGLDTVQAIGRPCMTSARNRCTHRHPCWTGWSTPACSARS